MQYGRIKCPSCDKTYKCQISLRKHLERVHKMEDTQIMAFFKACDAAEEANHAK